MSVQSASRILHDAERTLFAHWRRVNEAWNDEAATRFHQEFLEDLPAALRSAAGALNEMAEAMQRARRECDRDE